MEARATPDVPTRLQEAVDSLVGESIDTFSTEALGADMIDIRRAIDRLEAEFLRRLYHFHSERGAQTDGGGSTVSWLRRSCGMTAKAAAYRHHLARSLGELPATLDSAREGRATFGNAAMIGHLAGDVGVKQVASMEPILVQGAETLDPARMRALTQAARLRLDPDGVLTDDNHAHQNRWFECEASYGGEYILRGMLDAEGGALLKTAIDALAHGLTPGETRPASQRRADALLDLAALQLRSGEHRDVHGQRPHLTLTVSAETLRADAGADAAPAVLSGVGPIHPETARRIACDAVRTVVTVAPVAATTDPAWASVNTPVVPLSVDRAGRTIPAHIRTALALRDDGCRFPECDVKAAWTDGHHIVYWSDGGPTELDNLVSLCRRHHRRVHEEGWRIHLADGVAIVEPPP
ncbi:MAG TPA: DUF222 domain-containing protein [Candidatus Dormibacteraeota bacterium]